MRSFRFQLALRYTATMAGGTLLASGAGFLALRTSLDRQIDASLSSVASIQAASVASDPGGEMHFHEWTLTPDEAAALRDLTRYAQIWNEEGESLGRSASLTSDLPVDSASLQRSATGDVAWSEASIDDRPIRSIYYPLGRLGSDHTRHILQVAAPLNARNATLQFAALFLAGLVLLVSAGSLLGSWWLAGQAVGALQEITEQAERIGAGTLGKKISAHADTAEFSRLVRVLNTMLARLASAFEAQRRFTADASHELRSPLTALRGELELARRRDRNPDEYRRVIDSALEETDRMTVLTENLLTLARSDAGVMHPRLQRIDLATRVRETVDRMRGKIEAKAQRIEIRARGDTEAVLDPDLMDRVVWNLVGNATKFTGPGGSIGVAVFPEGEELVLEVEDSGPGIPEGAADSIFERFSQGDASHASVEGTGLGLAIVRAIVQAHGGSVSAGNRLVGGALFRVRLPRAGGADAQ